MRTVNLFVVLFAVVVVVVVAAVEMKICDRDSCGVCQHNN
jgi:hypothetical protein